MQSQQLYIEDQKEIKDEDLLQLVGFKLGDEEYAIDVLKIQEIIRLVEITSVPRTESYVMGVMNLRGKVIPVVDLRVRFNLEKSDFDKKTRIIVVRFEKENIGFVVDEVTQVVRINKSMIEPTPPLVGNIGQEYILGICKYDERLIILLDIDSLIYEGKAIDSELKKKFKGGSGNLSDISNQKESAAETEPTNKIEEESINLSSSKNSSFVAVDEPIIEPEKQEITDTSNIDNIDALIAMELAKREAETEELNKKKKMVKEENIEDILNDAVKQAEDKINHNAEHVDQNDLDALIAMELAKREAETEEMIRRKKEAEKKNNLVDGIDLEKKNEPLTEEPSKTETKATSLVVEVDSIAEIRELAKKIIKGEEKDISIDIKGELGEIIRLIQNTKSKVDSLEPNLEKSTETVPTVSKTLEFVNNTTEEATYNLIQHCDELSSLYSELSERFREVEKLLESQNRDATLQKIEEIEELISKAEELGFNILQALEFQDITEQKINKVIKNVEEIGARFGSILGYVVATKGLDEEGEKASQDDIEKLLSDFGLN